MEKIIITIITPLLIYFFSPVRIKRWMDKLRKFFKKSWYYTFNFLDLFFHYNFISLRGKTKIHLRNTKEDMDIWGVFSKFKSTIVDRGCDQRPDNYQKVSVTFYGKRDFEGRPKYLTGVVSFGSHRWHSAENYSYKKWFKLRLWRHGVV